MKISTKIVLALLATSATSAWAVDGTIGTTSTATSGMSVTIPDEIELTGVLDPIVSVGSYTPGAGGIDVTDDVCVYTNDGSDFAGSQQYRITAKGAHVVGGGAGTDFFLSDGATKTIAYTVAWNDVTGSNVGEAALTANSQLVTLQTGATGTYPCAGTNARFHVVITNNNILSVPANTYTDTLTLIVDSFDG